MFTISQKLIGIFWKNVWSWIIAGHGIDQQSREAHSTLKFSRLSYIGLLDSYYTHGSSSIWKQSTTKAFYRGDFPVHCFCPSLHRRLLLNLSGSSLIKYFFTSHTKCQFVKALHWRKKTVPRLDHFLPKSLINGSVWSSVIWGVFNSISKAEPERKCIIVVMFNNSKRRNVWLYHIKE